MTDVDFTIRSEFSKRYQIAPQDRQRCGGHFGPQIGVNDCFCEAFCVRMIIQLGRFSRQHW